uniref:Uncharacterized protein n=1 Tax=Physcomitrium patens TaxID=3218 RepID=A0A2K1IHW1_PHYPA|nr:hypothetical protein PHYPA_027555 [Physcomitrium patens]
MKIRGHKRRWLVVTDPAWPVSIKEFRKPPCGKLKRLGQHQVDKSVDRNTTIAEAEGGAETSIPVVPPSSFRNGAEAVVGMRGVDKDNAKEGIQAQPTRTHNCPRCT